MADTKPVTIECPYWCPLCEHICTMTVCGLYVPLPEHVSQFCLSARWHQCPQHLRGCERLLDLNRKRGLSQQQGRRCYPRFTRRIELVLFPAVDGEDSEDTANFLSWTIDLGLGGMRVETGVALSCGMKIYFVFGDDSLHPGFIGQAEVRWNSVIKSTDNYQCGLYFVDKSSSGIVGELLEAGSDLRN